VGGALVEKRRGRNPWGAWQGVFPEEVCGDGGGEGFGGLEVEVVDGVETVRAGAKMPWEGE
jgi:hypothetical protein